MANEQLKPKIAQMHERSRRTYGAPRVKSGLEHEGIKAFFRSTWNRQRKICIENPDQVWVGDVTYLKVGKQWRYLAVVMDRYTRRVLGWSLGKRRNVELTLQAYRQAARLHKPKAGRIFHSDRGIEYACHSYKAVLSQHGVLQRMNRPGQMNENAHMESFFHSFKSEALYRRKFDCDKALRHTMMSYIRYYNQERLHSALGYVSPVQFERMQLQ